MKPDFQEKSGFFFSNGGYIERLLSTRLGIADQTEWLYLQTAFAVVCLITSVLILVGIKNKYIKAIQLISTIAGAVTFAIIMIITSNQHARY